MIRIARENETVSIRFESDLPANCENTKVFTYPFSYTFRDTGDAELFRRYFSKRLCDEIKRIRDDAYESGWRDKSAKRRKRTCFDGLL